MYSNSTIEFEQDFYDKNRNFEESLLKSNNPFIGMP